MSVVAMSAPSKQPPPPLMLLFCSMVLGLLWAVAGLYLSNLLTGNKNIDLWSNGNRVFWLPTLIGGSSASPISAWLWWRAQLRRQALPNAGLWPIFGYGLLSVGFGVVIGVSIAFFLLFTGIFNLTSSSTGPKFYDFFYFLLIATPFGFALAFTSVIPLLPIFAPSQSWLWRWFWRQFEQNQP
jgi:hypothetical protein